MRAFKKRFRDLLIKAKDDNKTIAGYGATSKSTTILNYCNVGPELIDFISDTTPIKQNTQQLQVCMFQFCLMNILKRISQM